MLSRQKALSPASGSDGSAVVRTLCTSLQAVHQLRSSAGAAVLRTQADSCRGIARETAGSRAVATQAAAAALVVSEVESEYFREVSGGDAELNAAAPTDFYQLLSIDYDADSTAIRAAYRSLQRIAHPDIAGDRAHELAVLLNCAYATLSNAKTKERYDSGLRQFRSEHMHYDGIPVSQWFGPPGEQRAVFVDESQCIGCMACTWVCPSTFIMEDDFGRARVAKQWADGADAVSEAMDLCPVDSIHYVPRDQLALLEFVMRDCERESTAILADRRSGNMSPAPNSHSPFEQAAAFLRHRKAARPTKSDGTLALHHDQDLAASISRAWIALPGDLRRAGWPSWCEHAELVTA